MKIASAIVKNGEIEQRKQISTPQDDATQAMHQTLLQLLKEYEGQFDYVAVASTGIINQGILTALNPKNLGGLAHFPLKTALHSILINRLGCLMTCKLQPMPSINYKILMMCKTLPLLRFPLA